jgi:hypothetical protein
VLTDVEIRRLAGDDTHAPLTGMPSSMEVEMARPDITDLTERIATLERGMETMRVSVASYQSGRTERFTLSSTKAGWTAALVAFMGMIAAIVIATLSG